MQIVDDVVQALVLHDALGATLTAAPPDVVGALLQHVRRQLGSPGTANHALALAGRLLDSCPSALAGEPHVLDRLQQLRSAVAEELGTQERLMVVQGMVSAMHQS